MLAFMLDSNVCIRVMRGKDDWMRRRLEEEANRSCLSTIVVHELLAGAAMSQRPDFHRSVVLELADQLTVLDFDSDAAAHSAEIAGALGKRGALIGVADMLIAGHCRSLGLTLITSDLGDFARVTGLASEDWLAEGQHP